MQKIIFLIGSCILGLGLMAQDNGNSGIVTNRFSVSARAQALAGQLGGLENAGIISGAEVASTMRLDGYEMVLSHASIFKGMGAYEMVFGMPYQIAGQDVSIGFGVRRFSYGEFTETNQFGQELGTFTLSDNAFKVFGSWFYQENISFGAQLEYQTMRLQNSSASQLAGSINATYAEPERGLIFTADLRNHGFILSNNIGTELDVEPEWRLYASKKLQGSPFRFMLTWTNLREWDVVYRDPNAQPTTDPIIGNVIPVNEPSTFEKGLSHLVFGSEISFSKHIAVYVGYDYRRRQENLYTQKPGTVGVAWGAKVGVKSFTVEYARNKVHLSNSINSFSVFIPFKAKRKKAKLEA